MPTYEYRCPMGHDFEHFARRISDAAASLPCPTCGAAAARRISAGGGLLFKGSGFYITDYGKDGKKDQRATAGAGNAPASSPADGGKAADSGPAGGREAKPAGTDGAKPAAGGSAKPAGGGDAKSAAPKPASGGPSAA